MVGGGARGGWGWGQRWLGVGPEGWQVALSCDCLLMSVNVVLEHVSLPRHWGEGGMVGVKEPQVFGVSQLDR